MEYKSRGPFGVDKRANQRRQIFALRGDAALGRMFNFGREICQRDAGRYDSVLPR
jgi:hypothetical protein